MLGADSHGKRAGLIPHSLAPIQYQVHQQLLELGSVALDRRALIDDVHYEHDFFRDRRPDQGTHLRDELADIHRLDDELTLSGVCEQLAGKIGRPLTGLQYVLEHIGGLFVSPRRQGTTRQTGVPHDSGEQVVEVVRYATGEHADAFQLLGLAEGLLLFPDRLFRLSLLTDVTHYQHRTSYGALSMNGRNGAGDRKHPAILVNEEIILAPQRFFGDQYLHVRAVVHRIR